MCAAAFFLFRMNGNTFSESASYAIITVFMLLSFIRQISFITGYSIISTCIEFFFLIASIILIFRHRSYFPGIVTTLKSFGSANFVPFIFLVLCFLYMAVHAFLSVPKEVYNELYNIIMKKLDFFLLQSLLNFRDFYRLTIVFCSILSCGLA